MKLLICLLFTGVGALESSVPEPTLDLTRVKLYALSASSSTKAQIIQRLGKPAKTTQPEYECGFLSSAEQGKTYYSLHYQNVVFTGNAQEGYLLENVEFDAAGKVVLTYGKSTFSGQTSVADLQRIVGGKLLFDAEKEGTTWTLIRSPKGSNDGATFHFRNGRLVEFNYWSPC